MGIKEALRILTQNGGELYCKICTVDTVDENARTVDVSPLDESTPILGVNLQANQNGDAGVVMFPKVGSFVGVSFLNNATAIVVLYDEIDRIEVKTTADVTIEAGGKVQIKNNSYSLIDVFNDLITAIGKLTVTTAVGQSGIPINLTEFQQIQQKINNFLQ